MVSQHTAFPRFSETYFVCKYQLLAQERVHDKYLIIILQSGANEEHFEGILMKTRDGLRVNVQTDLTFARNNTTIRELQES